MWGVFWVHLPDQNKISDKIQIKTNIWVFEIFVQFYNLTNQGDIFCKIPTTTSMIADIHKGLSPRIDL